MLVILLEKVIFEMVHKFIYHFNQCTDILKWLPILIIFHHGLSAESIKPPRTCDNSLTPALNYYGTKARLKFTGSCLKQSKISYTHGKIVNTYIAYELGASSSHINDSTLKNCLFGEVTLTINADIDKYGYSGYESQGECQWKTPSMNCKSGASHI